MRILPVLFKAGFYEVLSIRPGADGSLVYTAYPVGQEKTSFTSTTITSHTAMFVNADHDYPQKIEYTRKSEHLRATISMLDGSRPVSFDKLACD